MSDYYSTVGVAENNLCTHVDESVYEEQTALKHLLMEEYRALCLRGHHDEHRQEVGRQSGPRCIGQRHDGAVDKRVDDIMCLTGHEQVVALHLHLHAQSAEGIGNDAQVLQRHVLDANAASTHGRHTDERAHLNHVGQQAVLRPTERLDALDGEQVRAYALNLGAHAVQHVAQLLHVRFAGSIIDGGNARRHDGSHDDVGRTGHRRLVQQHVGSLQLCGTDFIDAARLNLSELGTQLLETEEVGVQSATTNLVATRLGNDSLAHTRQQRTNHQHRTAQLGTLSDELVALQECHIQAVGLEGIGTISSGHLHANLAQQLDEVVDVADVGDVTDGYRVCRQQRGTDDLQCLVLGALRGNGTAQQVSAFNLE